MEKPSPTRKFRVLVADDSRAITRRLVALLAESEQIEIIGPVGTGDTAIERFRNDRPDAVLLDLDMPGRGGFDVLAAIRQQSSRCTVIVLTNHHGEEFRRRSLQAGADFFLAKSTEFERSVAIIRKLAAERDGSFGNTSASG